METRATYVTDEAYIWIEYGFLNQVNGFSELDDVLLFLGKAERVFKKVGALVARHVPCAQRG